MGVRRHTLGHRAPMGESPTGPGALTGVVSHELLQAVELGAGGNVEPAAVQFPDLVVFHI